jgi:hypothetical protein
MYQGALPPASNRAGLDLVYEVVDDDTGETIDLSAAAIAFDVRDPKSGAQLLCASTANGKVSLIDAGVFRVSFAAAEMQTLCADTYDVGCTITNGASEPQQFLIATLPVLDGVVRG